MNKLVGVPKKETQIRNTMIKFLLNQLMIQLKEWNKRQGIKGKSEVSKSQISLPNIFDNLFNIILLIIFILWGSYLLINQHNYGFCIISTESSKLEHFQQNVDNLQKQTISNWHAIYYFDSKKMTAQQLQQRNKYIQGKENIQMIESSSNQNEKIYDGIFNKCLQNDNYVILLNEDQVLYQQNSLQQLLNAISFSQFLLMIVPFIQNEQVHYPDSDLAYFYRDRYFSEDQPRKNIDLINNMSNHFRVFAKNQFYIVSHWDLLDNKHNFFDSKISFLLPLYELSAKGIQVILQYAMQQTIQNYTVYNSRCFFTQKPLFIKYKNLDFQRAQIINQIGRKIMYEPYELSIPKSIYYSDSYPKIYSQSKRIAIKKNKTQDVKHIPKKIHQIWIGDTIPQYKLKFNSRFSQIMPQFEYRLWGNEDINALNFPKTFQYIDKLLNIHRTFPYSRYSMIADLMKYEIVYQHGGYYFDTNYEIFQSFSEYTNYSFLIVMEQGGYAGQYIATSFFAGIAHSKYLQRILTQQMLSSINMRSTQANIQTGPAYLAKSFYPDDFFDDIMVFSTREILPFEYWVFDKRMTSFRCSYYVQQKIPSIYQGFYEQIFWVGNRKILYPCSKFYRYSYGVDHFDLGGSWMHEKSSKN